MVVVMQKNDVIVTMIPSMDQFQTAFIFIKLEKATSFEAGWNFLYKDFLFVPKQLS